MTRNMETNRQTHNDSRDAAIADNANALSTVSRAQQWKRIRINPRLRGQHGGILDEYGFYLLLVAFSLVAILVLFSGNSTDSQVQQFTTELNKVMGKVKTNYRGRYGTVTIAAVVGNGTFKDLTTMTVEGNTVTVQPGGGSLTIAPGKLLTTNDSVQYTIPNQPDAACTQIAAAFQSSAGKIVVNGTAIKDVGSSVNMTEVRCSSDSNTIDLYMS